MVLSKSQDIQRKKKAMSKGKKNKQINHEKDLMKDLLHKDFKTIVLKMYKD
jgi:hypothetical protein